MIRKFYIVLNWISAVLVTSSLLMFFYLFFLNLYNPVDNDAFLFKMYCNNFILILPIGLSYIASHRTAELWQYLIATILIIGLSYIISSSVPIAVSAGTICYWRFMGRLNKTEIWIDSLKMGPIFIMVMIYIVGIIIKNDTFKTIIFLNAVIYLLHTLLLDYVENLYNFVDQNKHTKNFPLNRIEQTYKVVLLSFFVILLIILIPLFLFKELFFSLENRLLDLLLNPFKLIVVKESNQDKIIRPSAPDIDLSKMLLQEEIEPPAILSYIGDIVIFIIGLGVIALAIYALYCLNKRYGYNHRMETDKIENIQPPKEESRIKITKSRGRRHKGQVGTVNYAIRKLYKKIIYENLSEPPKSHNTPKEIEREARLKDTWENNILHQYYEKARYSKEGCKDKDYEELKKYFK
ncbi:MAG: hypothetical protein GX288_06015 [Clostridiales bacterium]|nr:hypothetical protein [Clostridiales bacterium]